jgi:hypothetical protein
MTFHLVDSVVRSRLVLTLTLMYTTFLYAHFFINEKVLAKHNK